MSVDISHDVIPGIEADHDPLSLLVTSKASTEKLSEQLVARASGINAVEDVPNKAPSSTKIIKFSPLIVFILFELY